MASRFSTLVGIPLFLVGLLVHGPTWAQALAVRPGLSLAPPSGDSNPAALPEEKSPTIARYLAIGPSVVATVAGLALLNEGGLRGQNVSSWAGYGMLTLGLGVAPSVGHFYAGDTKHALITSSLRLVGCGISVLLWQAMAEDNAASSSSTDDTHNPYEILPVTLLALTASVTTAWFALGEILDAPVAAQRANARRGLTNLALVPFVSHAPGAKTFGLALTVRR